MVLTERSSSLPPSKGVERRDTRSSTKTKKNETGEVFAELLVPFRRQDFDLTEKYVVESASDLSEIFSKGQPENKSGMLETELFFRFQDQEGKWSECSFAIKEFDTAPKSIQIHYHSPSSLHSSFYQQLGLLLSEIRRSLPMHEIEFFGIELDSEHQRELLLEPSFEKDLFKRKRVVYRSRKRESGEQLDSSC